VGTSVELCANGLCATGLTGTEHSLSVPVDPGERIEARVRAVAPDGRKSEWAQIAITWPVPALHIAAEVEAWDGELLSRDIGGPLPGSVAEQNGVFTIQAAGADIWSRADSFTFAYRPLNGDGSITARVASLTNTHGWAKAGVMIRENLDADARHALAALTPSNGVVLQHRPVAGDVSLSTPSSTVVAPRWVRLTRAGDVFTAHQSANGTTWVAVGSPVTIAMSPRAFVGLAVTSHDAAVRTTAVIDSVEVR
jgi:hypothetical protein